MLKYLFVLIGFLLLLDGCKKEEDNPVKNTTEQPFGWTRTMSLQDSVVTCLAVSGNDLYAGTTTNGVYVSADAGIHWSPIGPAMEYVTALSVNGNNIFVGSYGHRVLFSANNGTNWTTLASDIVVSKSRVNCMVVLNDNVIVGMEQDAFFLSTNNGARWRAHHAGLPSPYMIPTALAVKGETILSVVSSTGAFGQKFAGGIYSCSISDTSWTLRRAVADSLWIPCLAVKDSSIFAGADYNGILYSTNNGTSWELTNAGLSGVAVLTLTIDGDKIYAGTTGGVFVSPFNGIDWTPMNSQLGNLTVTSLATSGGYLFAGTYGGVWKYKLQN